MVSRIDALAGRVRSDPFFLAQALDDYASGEGLDREQLAERLGCPLETLSLLMLCRRPRPAPSLFREDVQAISARFGIHSDVLARAVRHSDVVSAMRRTVGSEQGLLMAARDRNREDVRGDGSDS